MRYEKQRLQELTLDLDEDEIIGCDLVDCRILFGGKRFPVFVENHSEGCEFHFSDSARVTIEVLRRMLSIPTLRNLVLFELGLLGNEPQRLH